MEEKELLKQILEVQKLTCSAQLAQVALLQAIATSVGTLAGREHGGDAAGKVDWADALKALETGSFQLSTR